MPQKAVGTAGWAGSRRLLRALRDLMKRSGSGQERLDRVVELIAQDIVAEVCSIYVKRAGEVLELFATKGLNPEAVHRTRLRVGEGLVGQIAAQARPFALAEAQRHPAFAYRPETGEEIYHSLMGVPILRDGEVSGVLVVQNVTARHYTEEEVEALETVAMVLAELLAGSDLIGARESQHASAPSLLPGRLTGSSLNGGLAMGVAVEHHRGIVIRQVVGEDPELERSRLDNALDGMRSAIDDMLARIDMRDAGAHREILETYRMFAQDHGWLGRIDEAIRSGLTAEAAVQRVQQDTRRRMAQIKDPYMRERLSDLDDLANRLLSHLLGLEDAAPTELPEDFVLIARSLGPAELLDYDRTRLRAVVLEEGSHTAHVAIVARALEVPMVGRCKGLLAQARSGDWIVVDGDAGQVILRPNAAMKQSYAEAVAVQARRRAQYAATRDLPAVTRDGVGVGLQINAGLLIDLAQLPATGAEGIGLYRTEVPFMIWDSYPNVADQQELYNQVLDQAGDRPVVFRTLDIGGDKILPYWKGQPDENPAMGWRAIRIGLDRPAILRQQLRALIRAAAGRRLSVMFPMVSEVAELEAARRLLDRELAREARIGGALPSEIRVGAMLEVPALALQMEALAGRLDFLSVGTNDLVQFLYASDRGNPQLARRYDVLSPPVLKFLKRIARDARRAGLPLSLCGEMAGQPIEAMALIACGFRTLSMAPPQVAPVRDMVRHLEAGPLAAYLEQLLELPDHSLRGKLRTYARDHGVPI